MNIRHKRQRTEDYVDLKERLLNGETYTSIAKSYGCDRSTLRHHARKMGIPRKWIPRALQETEHETLEKKIPICKMLNCGRDARGRGYCHAHYQSWWLNGVEPTQLVGYRGPKKLCSIDACVEPRICRTLCKNHYRIALKRKQLPPILKKDLPTFRKPEVICDHRSARCDCLNAGVDYNTLRQRAILKQSKVREEVIAALHIAQLSYAPISR